MHEIFSSVILITGVGLLLCLAGVLGFSYKLTRSVRDLTTRFSDFTQLHHLLSTRIEDRGNQLETRLSDGLSQLHQELRQGLLSHTEVSRSNTEQQIKLVRESLQYLTGEVNKRLSDGFEKTTATFTDIVKRLALIDEAQKKITELSGNVVSLQEILTDKRSRGAFGEVQLSALVTNMIPQKHFSFQHTLSNGKRADCVLFLPEPTGTIAIDSKFPLENYQRFTDFALLEHERRVAEQLFKQDVKKHIQDVASKYILPKETADGAILFIPAEAVFATIHAEHPDLVEFAHRARVWMVSPTTLMAVLTTVRAVIKDEATREQVHMIQQHLIALAKDFARFQTRMDNLSKHISQVHLDVDDIQASAKKMTSRFQKIETVQLPGVPESSALEEIV